MTRQLLDDTPPTADALPPSERLCRERDEIDALREAERRQVCVLIELHPSSWDMVREDFNSLPW